MRYTRNLQRLFNCFHLFLLIYVCCPFVDSVWLSLSFYTYSVLCSYLICTSNQAFGRPAQNEERRLDPQHSPGEVGNIRGFINIESEIWPVKTRFSCISVVVAVQVWW